jgi:hypothetical protein
VGWRVRRQASRNDREGRRLQQVALIVAIIAALTSVASAIASIAVALC